MKTTYVYTPQGFLNKTTGEIEPIVHSSRVFMPQIMRGDDTEPLVSMADGKTYTSKAAMRESYKATHNPRGIEFVEVGDDKEYLNPVHKPLAAKKEDIASALDKAEAAVTRGEYDHVQ